MTGRDLLGARIPSPLKDAVDRENRPNQDVVEAALRRYLGTDDAAVLEMRLEHRRETRKMNVKERDALNRRIAEYDEEIEALEAQIETIRSARQTYAEGLDDLLDEMVESGMHVDPGHGSVDDLSELGDTRKEQVIADLRDRAYERGMDLPDEQFEAKGGGRR